MTEQKPIYVTDTAAEYWQKVAKQERQKADDNLRLAAERASTIQELSEELRELRAAKAEIERLKLKVETYVGEMAKAHTLMVEARAEIEQLKEIIRKVIAYCASSRVVYMGDFKAFIPQIDVEDVKVWQKAVEVGDE